MGEGGCVPTERGACDAHAADGACDAHAAGGACDARDAHAADCARPCFSAGARETSDTSAGFSAGMPCIRVRDFSWRYEGADNLSLDAVSLNVALGECVVIIGRSGCGKSTLTYALNGLIPHMHDGAFSGSVEVAGTDVLSSGTFDIARHVGSVFQDPRSQFFATTTTDEVAFGCENLGLPSEEIERRVDEALSALGATGLRDRDIFGLSSGERQKIAVASVLAMDPEIVVMDEPSANLDNEACAMLSGLVGTLKRSGRTVVIAEHRVHYLMGVADRFALMEKGHIAGEFARDEFAALGYRRAVELGVRVADVAQVPLPEAPLAGSRGAGVRLRGASSQRPSALDAGVPALGASNFLYEARGVRIAYGRDVALADASFSCVPGEVTAIVGRNGAGKTTLARVLAGLKRENAGAVLLDGTALDARARVAVSAFVMQDADYQLFTESVNAELHFARESTPELEERIGEVLDALGLAPLSAAHPMTLSGGQKQRLTIACALTGAARVVLFDEPTSGLDGGNMREVARLVRWLANQGRHVLVVTHDFEFIACACDRALCIEGGRVVAELPVCECNRERLYRVLGLALGMA